MRSKATHPHHHLITRAATGLFVLALLLLCTSQDAFAQNARVLQDYQNLEQAAEEAKEAHALQPTARSLQIMNNAVDRFKQFGQVNARAIEQAQRMNTPRKVQGTGGPDGFGYTYIDSNEPGGPVYSFVDATGGILVATGDDASSINSGIFAPVTLGTAPFNFYGTDYTDVVPATNGYISIFDGADGGPDLSNDCPLPATPSTPSGTPGGRIYPLHDDLDMDDNPGGGIYWDYFPSCPHPHSSGACDVFHYNGANHFFGADDFDFEVIMFDNNDIIYQYAPGNSEQGSGSTTGIQNPVNVEAPIGLTYETCNTVGHITDNLAVLIQYPDFSTADFSVDKTVDNDTPEVGEDVTFTITVTNEEGGSAFVRVTDELPDGVTYVSSTTTQGTYDPGTGEWNVGVMGVVGSQATLTITVTVDVAGTITNTAFIAFSSLPDPNSSNNSDSASVNPIAADLAVSKAVTAFSNEDGVISASFLVTVMNQGPNDVCGVEITDTLSPDMTLTGATVSQGVLVAGGSVLTWGVGCLDVGDSATLSASVTVPEGGSLTNTAEVTDADLPDPDSTPGDGEGDDFALASASPRTSPDFVPEGGPGGIVDRGNRFTADLKLDKTVDVASAPVGGTVHYTIQVENQGPQSTAKVVVTDHLPDCLTFDSATADRGAYDPDTWEWAIGKVKIGEVVTLEIWATVGPNCSGTVENTAEVTESSLPDPDDLFNLFDEAPVQDEIGSASFDVESGASARKLDGTTFALGTNYPNPFNPTTLIPFSIAEASHVSIKVYDLIGRTVATLVDGTMPAGVHEVRFDAAQLPTGMYMVRMEAAGQAHTQRITLMK